MGELSCPARGAVRRRCGTHVCDDRADGPDSAARHEDAALRPGHDDAEKTQSLFSPCCHLRRCSPNQEIMIAASKNGIMAVEIAAPSPNWPPMIAR